MFSGIVSHRGEVIALDTNREEWRVTIETDIELARCALGASIACNGVCLTVAQHEQAARGKICFEVQAGQTTRERTTLSEWSVGRVLNLECSLRLGDPLDGHLVMGHVDTRVRVARRVERENEIGLDLLFPEQEDEAAKEVRACCVSRGSVALDGVSLTVSACSEKGFSVAVIPYTAEHTTLGSLVEGERVNLEIDVWARYVARSVARVFAVRGDER